MKLLQRMGLMIALVAFAANVQPPIADANCTATCSCAVYTINNFSLTTVTLGIQSCLASAPVIIVTIPPGGISFIVPPPGGPCIFSAQVLAPIVQPVCFCPNFCGLAPPFFGIAVNPCSISVF